MRAWRALLLSGAIMTCVATSASATIVSVSASGGSTGTLIVNNACTNEFDGPALSITGCLNSDHNADVHFLSNENIQFDSGGGQAVVVPIDGLMQTLTVDPVAFSLGELILDIHALDANAGSNVDGYVKFCDNAGCWSPLFALDGNGENFFDITFDPSADFLTFSTYSDANGNAAAQLLEDSRQWRVEIGTSESVPEPATLSILGIGLLGLAGPVRRRMKASRRRG